MSTEKNCKLHSQVNQRRTAKLIKYTKAKILNNNSSIKAHKRLYLSLISITWQKIKMIQITRMKKFLMN